MKKSIILYMAIIFSLILTGCSNKEESTDAKERVKIGVMLSDDGLGDQSFSDLGLIGLEQARDELNISFDYREIQNTNTYENGLEELVAQGNDLIIGLGFSLQEALETIAPKYPDTMFVLIDSVSDVPNIYNVTFKEDEGSYLLGALAALRTESNVVGFIGGMDTPLIQKFERGFTAGVKSQNPEAQVLTTYANSFSDDKLGASIAKEMISAGADFIYPAAGFTGVGAILEAQKAGIYSFGVDSDQYYLAENSIVSSMLKQVDIAIFKTIKEFVETGEISEKNQVLGIKENGVNLAPIRVINLSPAEQSKLDKLQEDISNGSITIQ
ncbi:BMP family ABC transporter substrate-binding protein [Psychrobacillus sp. NEAU-3TGS]|uniref:BMP family lipoprotein n=1 Tax=Psychrobacillus sp. NEAU-3TGS TaxID=2995412 RepID=UPI00249959D2|nr:BMP family ABC transporter substrate-binding protein [Psychrobacillus sp. NEAU-3TGS]MDI2587159.1 BMP family ABC transporter substrate-binding protein [Psychrobacillus sp. NEAU-3TGS]